MKTLFIVLVAFANLVANAQLITTTASRRLLTNDSISGMVNYLGVSGGGGGGGSGGETNTASNLGSSTANAVGVYQQKSGVDLQFRSLVPGAFISFSTNATNITIAASQSGETNTASNLGGSTANAVGVYDSKSGTDLRFRSLVPAGFVTFTTNATNINISGAQSGETNTMSNLGTALAGSVGIYAQKSGVDLQVKSLVPGTYVTLTATATNVTIDHLQTGETNTASNLGTSTANAVGIYQQKSGTDLQFRSLVPGANITFSTNATNITITGTGGGSSPTTTRGDLIVRGASADQRLALGVPGALLISDGTDAVWFDPTKHVYSFDDFVSGTSASSWVGETPWTINNSSGNVSGGFNGENQARPGVWSLNVTAGSSSGSRATISKSTSAANMTFGGGVAHQWFAIKLPLTGNSTNDWTVRSGWLSSIAAESANGVYFRYNYNVNGGKWEAVCRNSSTETASDTGLAASTNWITLYSQVNASGTSAGFYTNGTLATTITNNIPTANGTFPALYIHCNASPSNTAAVYVDYYKHFVNLTSTR